MYPPVPGPPPGTTVPPSVSYVISGRSTRANPSITTSVIVIPADLAELVAQQDEAIRAEEAFCQALLAAGFSLDAAYPLPESMRPYLERYCEDGTVPTLDQIQEEFGSP